MLWNISNNFNKKDQIYSMPGLEELKILEDTKTLPLNSKLISDLILSSPIAINDIVTTGTNYTISNSGVGWTTDIGTYATWNSCTSSSDKTQQKIIEILRKAIVGLLSGNDITAHSRCILSSCLSEIDDLNNNI